ncbi:ABC transporter permease [Nocardioides humi]|uniref:ABC-2 type transport system permease protein n=1 Tax=Nocardioides humi TaxID=449461 RepID=A0ABN1ZQK1_9ACTN|nr:ABC transporter permease [Nocardioides humi]
MTAPAQPALTLDVSDTPRTPFLRLVGVEVRKTWDTRAGVWLLGTIVAITAIAMVIFFAIADADDRIFGNFVGFSATPQSFLLPVLGILLVTTEWSQRTAMVTFALEPSRTRVIASKVVAALIWGTGAFVAAIVIATLFTLVGGADDKFADATLTVFLLFFVLQLMTILQGLAYGLILLNTPAAIVVFFVLPIASSIIFGSISGLHDAAPWLDLGTAQSPLLEGDFDLSGQDYAQLGTAMLIWIVLPFVAGWFRVMRAEVK